MDAVGLRRVWVLYGWFSGLMLCGSCFGVVAWGAYMQILVLSFNMNNPSSTPLSVAQLDLMEAQTMLWLAAFIVTYAIEFLLLSAAKLMVLDRMTEFAAPKEDSMSLVAKANVPGAIGKSLHAHIHVIFNHDVCMLA